MIQAQVEVTISNETLARVFILIACVLFLSLLISKFK